jgi:hypothetical protein
MKNNQTELDVDFIGSQIKPITIEEKQLISVFIKKLKQIKILQLKQI